eukprot:scaffold704769_cov142-Attheya_sp.AAC.1
MQPSVSRSPSQMPMDPRSEEPSSTPILSMGPTSTASYRPTVSSEPTVSQSPVGTPSVRPME